jgi:hypothetical protein
MKNLWTSYRGWAIDGAIVGGLGVAVWKGVMTVGEAAPFVAAVVLAHAPPKSTAVETAVGPVVTRILSAISKRKA